MNNIEARLTQAFNQFTKGKKPSEWCPLLIPVSQKIWDHYTAKIGQPFEGHGQVLTDTEHGRAIVTARMICDPNLKGEDFTIAGKDVPPTQ